MTKEKRKIKRAAARDEKAKADALQAKADKKKRNMEAYKAKQHAEHARQERQFQKERKVMKARFADQKKTHNRLVRIEGAGAFMVTKKEKEPDNPERQQALAELKTLTDEFHQLTGTRIEISEP